MNGTKESEFVLQGLRPNTPRAGEIATALVVKVFLSMAVVILFSAKGMAVDQPQTHLFILSGQSNMTGGLKSGFSRVVEDHFGKDNVTVVYHCKSGRGIRFWDKDYRFPKDYRFSRQGSAFRTHETATWRSLRSFARTSPPSLRWELT